MAQGPSASSASAGEPAPPGPGSGTSGGRPPAGGLAPGPVLMVAASHSARPTRSQSKRAADRRHPKKVSSRGRVESVGLVLRPQWGGLDGQQQQLAPAARPGASGAARFPTGAAGRYSGRPQLQRNPVAETVPVLTARRPPAPPAKQLQRAKDTHASRQLTYKRAVRALLNEYLDGNDLADHLQSLMQASQEKWEDEHEFANRILDANLALGSVLQEAQLKNIFLKGVGLKLRALRRDINTRGL